MENGHRLPCLTHTRQLARFGTLATAITAISLTVVIIITLITAHVSFEDEPIYVGKLMGVYRESNLSFGLISVSLILIVCCLVHAGLSLMFWKGLKQDLLWHTGAWVRCHAVWLGFLLLGGGFVFSALVVGQAPIAAGVVAAATLASISMGVGGAVLVRRYLNVLAPAPWWFFCNLSDGCCIEVVPTTVQRVPPFASTVGEAPVTVQGGPPAPFLNKHTHPDLI